MSTIHFLDVKPGDCSIIQHSSGHVTMIDVCSAYIPAQQLGVYLDLHRCPVNPVKYLRTLSIPRLHRLIITHPDMDHIDGIHSVASEFQPVCFWDTKNSKYISQDKLQGDRQMENWYAYQTLRNNPGYYNSNLYFVESGNVDTGSGSLSLIYDDELIVLSPTKKLIELANRTKNYNDASCVILYKSYGKRILFCGDSHDNTWEHIIKTFPDDVRNVDIMLAPHHGRKSDRDWEFLDHVKPKLTIFGRASSDYLGYDAWKNRNLHVVTRPSVGSVIAKLNLFDIDIYVTRRQFNKPYRKSMTDCLFHGGFYWGSINFGGVSSEYL